MQEKPAIIERIRRVSPALQRLDITVEKAHRNISAGQFFLVRATESLDPYLREPWIPIHREQSSITIERPAGRTYLPGQVISLTGPIGKPIPVREATRTLLLIAYDATPASLLFLAETALSKEVAVTLILMGTARRYPAEALPQEIEIIHGNQDNNQWANQPETLKWADQIVAVAPPPFDIQHYAKLLENIRQARLEIATGYAWGLFQPPMPCGIGACQACLVSCKGQEIAACTDGPAFDLLSVEVNRD